jgi:hypothetical protein
MPGKASCQTQSVVRTPAPAYSRSIEFTEGMHHER